METINQIKSDKAELEKEISAKIQAFCEKNGVLLDDISLSVGDTFMGMYEPDKKDIYVSLTIKF
ncbi:hypothetical protein [Bacteroides reticulotermitis]|uniref:Uncharacterized protein n=2 Tax=Bacteroides reticulotermitis TaxID=1133319 RepID=W4US28_9BACE|nr:hypothetical protein [Bacteroides reticulotermitis]MBB4043803.1 hypothetical protein [Bacteroides reticulotermitis]GAE83324.1 hypothetical protein JCM10512_1589 [Bacteroides reticulotermitis JCM 10512]